MEKHNIWTTGITVKHYNGRWGALCDWHSGNFMQDGYMQGRIFTRYYEDTIEKAIDFVLEFMERMGVKRADEIEEMTDFHNFEIYFNSDEDTPQNEKVLRCIREEAKKRGWTTCV